MGKSLVSCFLTHGVVLLVLFTKLIRWTGRKRLVTQPGGLTLGFALHLVCARIMYEITVIGCVQTPDRMRSSFHSYNSRHIN